jgi:Ca2+/Na+ antiporter
LAMLASLGLVLVLAMPRKELRRGAGVALLVAYPVFVTWVVVSG